MYHLDIRFLVSYFFQMLRSFSFRKVLVILSILIALWLAFGLIQIGIMRHDDRQIKKSLPICKLGNAELKSLKSLSAGCYIRHNNKFLIVHYPIMVLNMSASNKYSVPSGSVDQGESSACAAARETFEETGIDVRVEKEIKSFANGFVLFECTPVNPVTAEQLKYTKLFEIAKIEFIDPVHIDMKKSRFPSQTAEILKYHNSVQ